MKKIVSVLLAFVLLFSLAACGKEESDDKTSSKPSTSSTPSSSSKKPSTSSSEPVASTPPIPPEQIEAPQFPASSEDVYSGFVIRYQLNDECKGYYFAPKKEGKYPTVIVMHGQGNVDNFKKRLLSNFNKWVKLGYIPPVVVVMPEVLTSYGPASSKNDSDIDDFENFIYKTHPKRFDALLTSIETGALSPRIDTSIAPYVSGFSMGGMSALHAGVEYNTRVKMVGGLSPAKAFYLGDGKWGTYNMAADIQFSKDPDARVYISAGQAERDFEGKPGFIETLNRYEQGIKVNNEAILTKFVAPSSWGGHSFALAQKELFMFLYFATFDKVPNLELVEAICNDPDDFKMPIVAYDEEIYNLDLS